MCVATLKLEDGSIVAFNLSLVSRMILDNNGLWFEIGDVYYATYEDYNFIRLYTNQDEINQFWIKYITM